MYRKGTGETSIGLSMRGPTRSRRKQTTFRNLDRASDMYVHVYAHRFTITWNVIARGVKGLSCGDPALFNLPRGGRKWRFCLVGVGWSSNFESVWFRQSGGRSKGWRSISPRKYRFQFASRLSIGRLQPFSTPFLSVSYWYLPTYRYSRDFQKLDTDFYYRLTSLPAIKVGSLKRNVWNSSVYGDNRESFYKPLSGHDQWEESSIRWCTVVRWKQRHA